LQKTSVSSQIEVEEKKFSFSLALFTIAFQSLNTQLARLSIEKVFGSFHPSLHALLIVLSLMKLFEKSAFPPRSVARFTQLFSTVFLKLNVFAFTYSSQLELASRFCFLPAFSVGKYVKEV
jgi:hypothetical protein